MVGYTRDYQPPTLLTSNILRAHNFPEDVWESLNDNRRLNAVALDQPVIDRLLESNLIVQVAKMILTPEKCNHFEAQTRELRDSYDQSWRDKARADEKRVLQIRGNMIWWTVAPVSIVLTLALVSTAVLSAGNTVMWMVGYLVFGMAALFWLIIVLDRMTKAQLAGPSSLEHYSQLYDEQKQLVLKLWFEQNQ